MSGGEPTEYVVGRVRETIARHPGLNELHLEIAVAGGRLFLTGVVGTDERRQELGRVVEEAAPGYEVCNQTELASFSEAEGVEELP